MKKQKVKLNQSMIFEKLENEGFLYNPEKDEIFSLNETALLIIESLKNKERDAAEIVEIVFDIFNGEKEVIEKDVEEFILELEKNNFLSCA